MGRRTRTRVVHRRPAAHTVRQLRNPHLSAAGVELDRKLAALLEALRVEVPMALLSSTVRA